MSQLTAQTTIPKCPHFGACGGCQYQDVAYPAQLERKRDMLAEMIDEAEYNLEPTRSYGGLVWEMTPPCLRATYARMERIEQLMARHPEWQRKS